MSITQQQLEAIISNILVPNTDVVKEATATMTKLLKYPNIVPPLLNILCNHQRPEIRQMSGVLLRKKISKLWPKLDSNVHEQIQNTLVNIINTEQVRIIAITTAEVMISIGRITIPIGKWPQLLNQILQWTQSTSEIHKEIAFGLILELSKFYVVAQIPNLLENLFQLVCNTLSTNSSFKLKVLAVQVLGSVYDFIDSVQSFSRFEQITPLVVSLLKQCCDTDSDSEFCDIMDVMGDLVEGFAELDEFDPVTQRVTSPIAAFSIEAAKTRTVDSTIRQSALLFLNTFISNQLNYCVQQQLIPSFVELLITILSEYNPLDPTDEESPHRPYAAQVLATIGEMIPSSDFFPLYWAIVQPILSSNETGPRCAVLLSLSALAYTCPYSIDDSASALSPYLQSSLSHPDVAVRGSALKCIGDLGEASVTFIYENCISFFKVLVNSTRDAQPELQAAAFFDIHLMVEKLSFPEIEPVAGDLLSLCIGSANSTDFDVRDSALSALTGVVFLANKHILPYAQTILNIAQNLLSSATTEDIEMVQKRSGYLNDTLTIIRQLLQIQHPFEFELRQFCYTSLIDLYSTYGEELIPLLNEILPKILYTLESEEDVVAPTDLEISTHTGLITEKAAALTLLSKLFETVPMAFSQNYQTLMTKIVSLCSDERCEISEAACEALWSVLYIPLAADGLYKPLGENPKNNYFGVINGDSVAAVHLNIPQITATIAPFYNTVINTYFFIIENNEYRDVVMTCFNKLIDVFTMLGRAGVLACVKDLGDLILKVMTQKTNCQIITSGDDSQEIHEAEGDLLSTTSDVVMLLFKMFGSQMSDYFVQIFSILSSIISKRNNSTTKETCVGIIAEFFNCAKVCPPQILEPSLTLFLNCMQNRNEHIARNAIFGFGVLASISYSLNTQLVFNACQQALQIISEKLQTSKLRGSLDNIVSCVCRIISIQGCPFAPAPILGQLIKFLPIVNDHEEELIVYNTFAHFYSTIPELQQQKSQLVEVFRKALEVDGVREETKNALKQFLM
ncbi:HEAT repeat domain containing protein [Entamoeba marina]